MANATNALVCSLTDAEMEVTVTFEPQELAYVEWDGYPDAPFMSAEWFLVELEGDEASYFPDLNDLNDPAREAIYNYCDGLTTGAIEQ